MERVEGIVEDITLRKEGGFLNQTSISNNTDLVIIFGSQFANV